MLQTYLNLKKIKISKNTFVIFCCFFQFQNILYKHSQISVGINFLGSNFHRALSVSLPFRQKNQIQNWIKFTFAKSQVNCLGFFITVIIKPKKINCDFAKVNCIQFWIRNCFMKGRETQSSMQIGRKKCNSNIDIVLEIFRFFLSKKWQIFFENCIFPRSYLCSMQGKDR